MADALVNRPRGVRMMVLAPMVVLVLGAVWWKKSQNDYQKSSTENFVPRYEAPSGWKTLPHGPQTLFLYKDPQSNLLMRGAVNQIISDVNPTPELDTGGIAQFYIDRTHENMKDWTATELETVKGQADFSVIRRAKRGRVVVTAFAVRGNTTLLVSLSGADKNAANVDGELPKFFSYLKTIQLQRKDMSDL